MGYGGEGDQDRGLESGFMFWRYLLFEDGYKEGRYGRNRRKGTNRVGGYMLKK